MKSKIITIVFITIFSILLWVFISFSNEYSTTVRVPVVIGNLPEGYSIKELSNNEVTIAVKGEGWQLSQLSFGIDHELLINATDKKHQSVSVRSALEQNSWLPTSIELSLVEPEQVSFEIERSLVKKIKVVQNTNLEFKPGFGLVSGINLIPDSMEISGSRSLVQTIDSVSTEELNLSDIEKKTIAQVRIEKLENIKYSSDLVSVEFDVQKIVDKTFENIEVKRRNVPPSRELTIFPESVTVTLRGGINLLGRLSEKEIAAYVYFRQALEDTTGGIVPHIEIPDFTSLVDVKPNRLEYIIRQF